MTTNINVVKFFKLYMSDLRIISIISERCNYDCSHCSTSSSRGSTDELEYTGLEKTLKEFSDFNGNKIHTISGGEPTLNSNLRKIADLSMDLGYTTCVITNAWWVKLDNPEKSRQFLEKRFPKGVEISASYDLPHEKLINKF